MKKQCFKCKQELSLSEFYQHTRMKDGHLNKCKTCAKRDVQERYSVVRLNPDWVAKERERCRVKSQIAWRLGKARKTSSEDRERWRLKNPEKVRASVAANNAIRDGKIKKKTSCERCGAFGVRLEKHHADYSQPLNVVWLCSVCHTKTKALVRYL